MAWRAGKWFAGDLWHTPLTLMLESNMFFTYFADFVRAVGRRNSFT